MHSSESYFATELYISAEWRAHSRHSSFLSFTFTFPSPCPESRSQPYLHRFPFPRPTPDPQIPLKHPLLINRRDIPKCFRLLDPASIARFGVSCRHHDANSCFCRSSTDNSSRICHETTCPDHPELPCTWNCRPYVRRRYRRI
jgi:hypothetical protein